VTCAPFFGLEVKKSFVRLNYVSIELYRSYYVDHSYSSRLARGEAGDMVSLLSLPLRFESRKWAYSFVLRQYWIALPSFYLYDSYRPRFRRGEGGKTY